MRSIEAYSCNLCILDPLGDGPQVACMTTDDWHQAQWVDPVLGPVISRLQDGPLGQHPFKQTAHLSSGSSFGNTTTSNWGGASCIENTAKRSPGGPIPIGLASHALGDCSERVPWWGQPFMPQRMLNLMCDHFFWPQMAIQAKKHIKIAANASLSRQSNSGPPWTILWLCIPWS